MGAAVGQVPEYIQDVTGWCKTHSDLPVFVKLTPNITDVRFPARAAKAGSETYDVIVLDLTEPVGPSAALFTEGFCADLAALVSDSGVIVDSDSIFLSCGGGHFLQELSGGGENLVSVMRRTKLLPHIEVYRTKIPLYPGADFGFFLYSRDGVSLRRPVAAYQGRHYGPDIHQAAFALPRWQREWLRLENTSTTIARS